MHLFESKIEIKNTSDSIKRMSDIANGDYVAVVTSVNNDEIFTVLFSKCNRKNILFLMKMIMMKLVLKVYLKNFLHLKLNKK